MNKTIAYLLLALTSFHASILHAQGNNRQQAVSNNAQDNFLFYHTVERGETVYSITKTYDVDTATIYRLNPGSNEVIKVGQQLKIPQGKPTDFESKEVYIYHTIQGKETLFSLSQKYQVRAEDIMEANPGLSVSTFQIGKNIRVPINLVKKESTTERTAEIKYMEYKVKKRETLFNITRKYEVTESVLLDVNPELKKGLKEGMTIRIPVKELSSSAVYSRQNENDANALLNTLGKMNKVDTIKLALLLPFNIDEQPASPNVARFVEYYEGLLLAIDSLQRNGLSVKLTVRDVGYGAKKLNEVLKEKFMGEAHLIIGGVDNEQIDAIATFSLRNQIKYVIPFTSKNDEVRANANIFQVNTPHHYLLAQAAFTVYTLFKDYNIIFVDTRDPDDKLEFVGLAKQEFSQHNVFFRDVPYNAENFYSDMERLLRKDRPNVVIPMSAKTACLNKIKPALRTLSEKMPDAQITLFGYPEWLGYIRDNLNDLFAFNTYIYSSFYADNNASSVNRLQTKFRITYGKTLNGYPKFGILGFDTGIFFLDAIRRYGLSFESYLDRLNTKGLQISFRFKRVNNWGGFINTGFFIIHFNKENSKIQWQEIR
ncbi:MAG: LysM peptidoglycan-binding domain-containing protein [Tannerellaceae bacterium]|jgi:LysM repeat protein|nr:LysM peptidoglycan-binding domain-containing protein [Tannerellaceae bacterium]